MQKRIINGKSPTRKMREIEVRESASLCDSVFSPKVWKRHRSITVLANLCLVPQFHHFSDIKVREAILS